MWSGVWPLSGVWSSVLCKGAMVWYVIYIGVEKLVYNMGITFENGGKVVSYNNFNI